MKKAAYLTGLIAALSCVFTTTNPLPNMETVEEILSKEVMKERTPSVQYTFFNETSILYEYSLSYANLDGLKVDKNTTFNAYSLTKTFTALSIAQLAEQGLISLEAPARQYIPDAPIAGNITIKHLLTHTAGIGNPLPVGWIHLAAEHASFDRNRFFEPILARYGKPRSTPGHRFSYSNLGYLLLGQVIEAVSGESYEQYVTEHIINQLPIEAGELGFTIPHPALHAQGYHRRRSISMLALGFLLDKRKYMGTSSSSWKPFKQIYVNGAAYGGLIGTVTGFVSYGQALLRDDDHIISREYKKLLFTENRTTQNKPTGMGLSWFSGHLQGHAYLTHAGGGGGYYCELRLYPELKAGSFIVFNRSGFSDKRFLDKVDIHLLAHPEINLRSPSHTPVSQTAG